MIQTYIKCPDCEITVKLTEDGHCTNCGKHFDNMYPRLTEETYDDWIKRRQQLLQGPIN